MSDGLSREISRGVRKFGSDTHGYTKKSMHYELMYFKLFLLLLQLTSLIEELSASHSTDLQQRAYELQATIGLDAQAVGNIMPADASCEDVEVTFFFAILFFSLYWL